MDSSQQPVVSKGVSIVIPAYNEEDKIALTIKEAHQAATSALQDFEIIVVDDGSHDHTYARAHAVAQDLGDRVRVIRQPDNRGVGAAYHYGLRHARYSMLTLIPGDRAFEYSGVLRVLQ